MGVIGEHVTEVGLGEEQKIWDKKLGNTLEKLYWNCDFRNQTAAVREIKYLLFKMEELIVCLCGGWWSNRKRQIDDYKREKRTAIAKSLSKLREIGT